MVCEKSTPKTGCAVLPSALVLMILGHKECLNGMGFDRGRKGDRGGRGRDKRDGFFSEDSFQDRGGFQERGGFGQPRSFGDRGGFGGGDRGGGGGGGFRGGGGGGGGMPPQVVGEAKGIVKFFNPQKGFGFIVRDDGGEDVFVHISAVEQAGLSDLAEGQPLGFTLVDRGGRISATNIQIEGEPIAVERQEKAPQRQLTGEKAQGTVKFFNSMKGFGFISRDDGQPDAFVHISAVERAGLPTINEGDRFEFDIEVDRRGKYAAVNLQPLA